MPLAAIGWTLPSFEGGGAIPTDQDRGGGGVAAFRRRAAAFQSEPRSSPARHRRPARGIMTGGREHTRPVRHR